MLSSILKHCQAIRSVSDLSSITFETSLILYLSSLHIWLCGQSHTSIATTTHLQYYHPPHQQCPHHHHHSAHTQINLTHPSHSPPPPSLANAHPHPALFIRTSTQPNAASHPPLPQSTPSANPPSHHQMVQSVLPEAASALATHPASTAHALPQARNAEAARTEKRKAVVRAPQARS